MERGVFVEEDGFSGCCRSKHDECDDDGVEVGEEEEEEEEEEEQRKPSGKVFKNLLGPT